MADVNVAFVVQTYMIYMWTNDTLFFDEMYPVAIRALIWLIKEASHGRYTLGHILLIISHHFSYSVLYYNLLCKFLCCLRSVKFHALSEVRFSGGTDKSA